MWLRRVVSGVVAGVLVVSVGSVPTAGAVDAAGLRGSVSVAASVVPGAVSTGGGGVVPEPLSGRDFSSLPGSVVPSAGAGRVANGPVLPGVPEDVSVLPVVSRGEKFDV